jgi:hypothetical protein
MTDVFIPPEGAMQFEVLRDWNQDIPEEDRPIVLWVMPPEPYPGRKRHKPDCPHTKAYKAVAIAKGPRRMSLSGLGKDVVCECVGRLIE